MYITAANVITIAALIAALAAIARYFVKAYDLYKKQSTQDRQIKQLREEQSVICYALLACLDGLNQLGANGRNVTKARDELEKHINKSAHNWSDGQ